MFDDTTIAGDWAVLVDRLGAGSTLASWGAVEPALAGLSRVEEPLPALTRGADQARADTLLRRLGPLGGR